MTDTLIQPNKPEIMNIHREKSKDIDDDIASFCEQPFSEKNGTSPTPLDMSVADAQNTEQMKINEEAKMIFNEGRALEYMIDTCQKIHVSDVYAQQGIILSYADTKVNGSKGIHTFLKGETGAGKSHCAETVAKILPDNSVLECTISDKALYRYSGLQPETLIIVDDQTMTDTASEIFKSNTTDWNDPKPYLVSEKVNGNWTAVPKYLPPRCPFCYVKANYTGDEQTFDRQIVFDIKNDVEKLRAIREYQNARAINPDLVKDDHSILVSKSIWQFVNHETVSIPYARDIVCKSLEGSRVYNQMLELTSASAVMSAPKRNRDKSGYIIASIEDFKTASRILNSEEGAQRDDLGSEAKELLQYLQKLPTDDYFFKDIRTGSKMSATRLHYALYGRDKNNKDIGGLRSLPGGAVGTRNEGREGVIEWNRELYEEFKDAGLSLFSMNENMISHWYNVERR